jgi:hypothetical protein
MSEERGARREERSDRTAKPHHRKHRDTSKDERVREASSKHQAPRAQAKVRRLPKGGSADEELRGGAVRRVLVLVQRALRLCPELESPRNLHRACGGSGGCLVLLLLLGLWCQPVHGHIATVTSATAAADIRHRRRRRERRRWASDDLGGECGAQECGSTRGYARGSGTSLDAELGKS